MRMHVLVAVLGVFRGRTAAEAAAQTYPNKSINRDRAVRRRWADRRRRPHRRRAHVAHAGPATRGRERRRRGRDDGHDARRPGPARRLHGRRRQHGHAVGCPGALSQPQVRPGNELRPGRHLQLHAAGDRGQERHAGRQPAASSSTTSRPTAPSSATVMPAWGRSPTSPASLFNAQFGFKPALVAYRGTNPALNDLVGGQIDYMVDQALNVINYSSRVRQSGSSEMIASDRARPRRERADPGPSTPSFLSRTSRTRPRRSEWIRSTSRSDSSARVRPAQVHASSNASAAAAASGAPDRPGPAAHRSGRGVSACQAWRGGSCDGEVVDIAPWTAVRVPPRR